MKSIEEFKNKIICGDALGVLKEIPDESIDMVITSPPYYALRNYQVGGQIGLESTFEEYLKKILDITAEIKRVLKKSGSFWLNLGDIYGLHTFGNSKSAGGIQKKLCQEAEGFPRYSNKAKSLGDKCLGMMPERIALAMIDQQGWILRNKIKWAKQVFVKKENRTIGSVMPTSVKDRFNESGEELYFFVKNKKYYSNLDAVRLKIQTSENRDMGIIRQLNYKESKYNNFNYRVRDAKRKQGQPQFRASEKEIKKYQGKFADKPDAEIFGSPRARTQRKWKQEEVEGYKMGSVDPHRAALRGGLKRWRGQKEAGLPATYIGPTGEDHNLLNNPLGKNLPTIWQIQSEPHNFQKELNVNADHFAIFPQALLEIPIKFGCPQQVCKKCGKPIIKIIKTNNPDGITGRRGKPMMTKGIVDLSEERNRIEKGHNSSVFYSGKIVGYSSCNCNVGFEPGIVLDPFMGSGTTAIMAKKLGRNYIGIELNPEYIKIAETRIKKECPNDLFNS